MHIISTCSEPYSQCGKMASKRIIHETYGNLLNLGKSFCLTERLKEKIDEEPLKKGQW